MRPIAVDDVLKFKYLSEITISPEGGTACLAVTEADLKNNGYKSYLYLDHTQLYIQEFLLNCTHINTLQTVQHLIL